MTFHDIFAKKEKKQPHVHPLNPIIIDIHEKNSLVPASLTDLNIHFIFESLKVADYLIGDIAIERKTIRDLKSSIISKRIFTQLTNLKQHPKPLLLIEGFQEELTNNEILHENAIRGFLLSLVKEKIPCIITQNETDTARYLALLARKSSPKTLSIRPSRIIQSKEDQLQFILEGFPHVGPTKAKALIKKFKSLKAIINATEEELKPMLGKGTQEFLELLSTI